MAAYAPSPAIAEADARDCSRGVVTPEFVDAKWLMLGSFLCSLSFFLF
jgi:hypothetical protein